MTVCEICKKNDGELTGVKVFTDDKMFTYDHMCRECFSKIDDNVEITAAEPQYAIRTKMGKETAIVSDDYDYIRDIFRARDLGTVCEVIDNHRGIVIPQEE